MSRRLGGDWSCLVAVVTTNCCCWIPSLVFRPGHACPHALRTRPRPPLAFVLSVVPRPSHHTWEGRDAFGGRRTLLAVGIGVALTHGVGQEPAGDRKDRAGRPQGTGALDLATPRTANASPGRARHHIDRPTIHTASRISAPWPPLATALITQTDPLSFETMARKFIYSAAALLAALAAVDAFQVPRMSLEKYKSELAETAKKIASPGACLAGIDGGLEGRGEG